MQQYIGVVAILVIASLWSGFVWILINKDGNDLKNRLKKYIIKSFGFFCFIYYFLMSAMKYLLGYQKENLFESFWDIETATYTHYGAVLAIIGVIFPILFHMIFKGKEWQIIKFFDSVMFLLLFFAYLVVRKINNPIYCITFIAATMLTLFSLYYILKNDIVCINKNNWKSAVKQMIQFVLYWIVTIVIYTPNELYLNNSSDFPISYWYFLGKLMIGSLILFTISIIGALLFFTKKQLSFFCTLLFALLTIGYIQGMLLNGEMILLDGTTQAWSIQKQIVNLLIWIIFVGVILFLFFWKEEKTKKVIGLLSVYLVLIQVVSLGVLILTTDTSEEKKELALTRDGLLEVGDNNNVIVFVLDKFDGLIIDEILEEDATFINQLHDFTYYRNATSAYAPTSHGVPFLLTGSKWEKGTALEDWWEYAYEGDTLLSSLAEKNYDISVYTDSYLVSESMKDIISNYEEGVERTCELQDILDLMMQCSKYKMAPFVLKNYYQYDTSDITLLTADDFVYNAENDLPFYNSLMEQGLSIASKDGKNGTFKFIHMQGAHPPYTMTEDFQYIEYDARRDIHIGNKVSQAKGALKIVYEYLRQMQELGTYDDATIVITTDHGYVEWLCDEDGNMIRTSIPIIFVKEPQNKHESIVVSEAPVCHQDVITTIMENVGINTGERKCSEIAEDEERVRTFIYYTKGSAKFEVEGNVRDLDSWKMLYSTVGEE